VTAVRDSRQLPEALEADLPVEHYLHERYREAPANRQLVKGYYALRPLMPRALQLALRRWYAKQQAQVAFPRWPIEPILVERAKRDMKLRIEASPAGKVPLINFWPGRRRAAVVLTHDVESSAGVRNIPRVRSLERRYGVVSSWNFVAERYGFDRRIFRDLKADGCEIGLHGLYHDGKKFSSREVFNERLPRINAYLREWEAVGFRSPATHRNPDWMPEIAAAYDSSFPDTDPFEPQPGGCCSIFPFFLGHLVELPITLVQDHTLIVILRHTNIDLWRSKASWIIENHGLVNIGVHPDYMLTARNLRYYEEFLAFITSRSDLWCALPRDVAQWWRDRSASEVVSAEARAPLIDGPARDRGCIAWAVLEGGLVKYVCREGGSSDIPSADPPHRRLSQAGSAHLERQE
jgi:peptidoglycan/xylan/chitin deacetylase (PgdA/CDA1 family)